jgi:hypothetical protein
MMEKPKTTFEILEACRVGAAVGSGEVTEATFDYEKLYMAVDALVLHRDAVASLLEKLGETVHLAKHVFDKEGG